jgi:tetratricopeptide (TPR) repeat protein
VQDDGDTLSKAYLYDNMGLALHHTGNHEGALKAFDTALALNFFAAHIYTHKGQTLQAMHRYNEAVACCGQAVALYPYHTESYTVQMEIFYETDLYDRMITLAQEAENAGYISPRVRYFKACALRMKGENDDARGILNELIHGDDDEDYGDYFFIELAFLDMAAGDYTAALTHIRRAVDINGEPVSRRVYLGYAHRMCGDFDAAIRVYGAVIRDYPSNFMALIGRGNVYFDTRDYENALRDFTRAQGVNDHNPLAYDRIVDTHIAMDNIPEALHWAERQMFKFESADGLLRLAWLYERNLNGGKAEEAYRRGLLKYADDARIRQHFAVFLKNAARYEEAVDYFKAGAAENAVEIAECYAHLKRFDEALAVLNTCAETPEIILQRGFVYYKMRRYDDALAQWAKGCEGSVPTHWNAAHMQMTIGMLYEYHYNDAKNAIEFLKKTNEGRATFLPLSAVKGKNTDTYRIKNEAGFIGVAADLIECENIYAPVISQRLGDIVIVDTLENALAIHKKFKYSYKIVTQSGERFSPGGAITGGSIARQSAGIIGRARQLEALKEQVDDLQNKMEKLLAKQRILNEKRAATREILSTTHEKAGTLSLERKNFQNKLTDADEILKKLHEMTQQFNEENNAIMARLVEANGAVRAAKAQLSQSEELAAKARADLENYQKEIEKNRQNITEESDALTEIRVEIAHKTDTVSHAAQNISRLQKEIDILNEEKRLLHAEISANESAAKKSASDCAEKIAQLKEFQTRMENARAELSQSEEEKNKLSNALNKTETDERTQADATALIEREIARREARKETFSQRNLGRI